MIVYPLLLDAADTVAEARKRLGQAGGLRWAAIRDDRRWPSALWYLLRVDALAARLDAADPAAALRGALEHADASPTVQLAELPGGAEPVVDLPTIVLDGTHLFGAVEPPVRAAAREVRGSGRAAGAAPPRAPAGSAAVDGLAAVGAAEPAGEIAAAADVSVPSSVRAGDKIKLGIGLKPLEGETAEGVRLPFEAGQHTLALDVDVVAPAFTCAAGWRHRLDVVREDPFAAKLQLRLTANDLPDDVESRGTSIVVHYSRAGVHCGTAVRRIQIHDGSSAVAAPAAGPRAAGSTIVFDAAAPPIDLTIRIAWRDDNEASNILDWSLLSPHPVELPAASLSKTLALGAAAFARQRLTELTGFDATAAIGDLLDAQGALIADAMPPGIWHALSGVAASVRASRGKDAVPTVLILSQESQVPWELARLPQPIDPSRPRFLATQCIVARWVLDSGASHPSPPAKLTIDDIAVIRGDYPPGGSWAALPNAKIEADTLEQNHSAQALEATLANVLGVLRCDLPVLAPERAGVELLHFACHGETGRTDAAASSVILNDGTPISPTFFRTPKVAERSRPLIFLNACQVGVAAPSLGMYGGFAGICVRAGFSGVIAPLWSVNDVAARDFALAFYDSVLGAAPPKVGVAEALFRLRQTPLATIRVKVARPDGTTVEEDRHTATPLAYVFYGHPGLVLERS